MFRVHHAVTVITLAGAALAAPPLAARADGAQDRPAGDTVRKRADALIAQMTPAEKAAQIMTVFSIPETAAQADSVATNGGGSILFVTDPNETNRLQRLAVEKSRLKIPILFAFDVIHGLSTIFPVPIGMAASWDPAMIERSQAIAATEASAVGIRWTFAPMVDIARDPRWGRIIEGAGEDPYLGGAVAAAQVHGFQGARIGSPGHIVAGVKHFVGYGAALGGRDYDEVDLSESALRNVYLPPFDAAIKAGAGNVMSAYMGVNGVPPSANRWLLTDVLRGDLGFKGWVVSDNQAVDDLKTHGLAADSQGAAVLGLNAGVDMEMSIFTPTFSQIPAALAAGAISTDRLDEAVRRVLEAKIRLGLFEKPYVDAATAASILRAPAHLEAARIAAERSAVLLRNEGGVLPLDRSTLRSVAVIGPLADSARDLVGPWVFDQNRPATQSIVAGLRAKLGQGVRVSYAPGVALPDRLHPSPFQTLVGAIKRPAPADDTSGIAEAVSQARAADVAVLVLGEAENMSGELASRSSLELPGRQQELLDAVVATGKPVVVLLVNGRPLDLKETKAAAILDIWYPGSRAGDAAANLLVGDAVPGGKLPFTWPRNIAQVPMIYSHLTSHAPRGAEERYWNEPSSPAYPFGYGLSYSRFAYAGLKVDQAQVAPGGTVTVSVDLTNTGTRTADEVAQLYIHQRLGTVSRPVRELKGFERVTLKPGETRTVTFKLGPDELRYWNAVKRDWVLESSTFDLWVGGSSRAELTTTFEVRKP